MRHIELAPVRGLIIFVLLCAIPAFAAPVAPLVQPRVNLAQIKLPIEFGQIITANGAHCPSMLACPFGVSSGPIWANWHVDGSGNLLVAAGGSPVSSGALTCPSAGACPLGLTPGGAWSFLNVDSSGNLLVALTGGAASVTSVFTRTGAVVAASGDYTCAQVTNCPTVLPTTAPAAGKIPVGNAGGTAYAPMSVSGDSTITSAGVMTNTGLNNTSLAGLSTGIMKNTTATGVPSIAVLADIAALFTGTGLVRNNGASSELSGDCTTSGSNATICTKATGPTLTISSAGNGNGALALSGTTSGTATLTAPAVAGTSTNGLVSSNVIVAPVGSTAAPTYSFAGATSTGWFLVGTGGTYSASNSNILSIFSSVFRVGSSIPIGWSAGDPTSVGADIANSRLAAGLEGVGTGAQASVGGFVKAAMTAAITTADVTCGTGGTISSCVAATTITGLTFTLPLFATNWAMDCDLVVGQATAATANQWLIQTATNGVTNTTASYTMATAATAMAVGAVTDQASTTTAFQIAPSWTLGGTATKMPVHIHATFEGVSVSGTVINLQVIAPTVGDLLTIYRGASCSLHP